MNLVYLSEQFMPRTPENEEARQFLGRVDAELQRVKLITAQSLRFYKRSTGPEAVTCSELITPIVDIYKPRFSNFSITVEKRERSLQHIVCLGSEIRQVVTNLIMNAINAMRSSGADCWSARMRRSTGKRDAGRPRDRSRYRCRHVERNVEQQLPGVLRGVRILVRFKVANQ